ncbi:MAG: amidohydrolase [Nitriliruptorales bacterium]
MSRLSAARSSRADEERSARGTLLVADRVVTLGRGRTAAKAVLVRGKKVVWVGDDPGEAPPHAERVELAGCTVGPGFVDSHVHLTPTGLGLLGLDLSGVRSGRELLEAVRARAATHPGRVVWGRGWDDHGFPDALPGPDELAEAAPGHAVYLSRVDGHSCLVDRETLTAAPLARADGVERDASGSPTAVLKRDAHHVVRRWTLGSMSQEELDAARETAASRAAAVGLTSVHEMGGPNVVGAEDFDAWLDSRWPVEVRAYWGDTDLAFVAERNLRQVGGDLSLDGSLGSRTAALSEPYDDHDGSGYLYYDDEELLAFFREATHAGIQVAVHAIGDAAIRQAVRLWRRIDSEAPEYLEGSVGRLRHRLEHAELLPTELLDDVADLGLVCSVQPAFDAVWGGPGGMYETRLGPARAAMMNPFRALADRGVALAFGSDSDVTPMAPWAGVVAAEQRAPEHQLSRLEAVSATCLGGRYAARQDGYTGVVRAGMRADLAVWEGDPFSADDPTAARCVLTVVKGRVTHGTAAGLPSWDATPRP